MSSWALVPPVAISLIVLATLLASRLMKGTSFRGEAGALARSAYSCGEEMPRNSYRPDYGQFFSYAFFFTIMHVAALMLATIPAGAPGPYMVAALYVAAALVGLRAILRTEK
jgi:NADH:ubiquinone oxidoreductase subunit 3 (subunit A)